MDKSKRNYFSIASLVITIILVLTIVLVNSRKDNSVSSNDKDREVIDLVFKPIEIEPLKAIELDEGQEIIQTIELENADRKLHLYVMKEDNLENESQDVYGVIEHGERLYDLSLISAYGKDNVDIDLLDITNDGKKEVRIIGSLGSTYTELKIISYNQNDNQWLNLLTMGSPYIADLDGDGSQEFIGVSTGVIPGYVDVYRWNGDSFAKASVTESTKNTYANLFNTGLTLENKEMQHDSWVIETGNQESEFFRYGKGKLIKTIID